MQAWIGSSASVCRHQCRGFRLDAEQLRHERVQMGPQRHDQIGFVAAGQAFGRGAGGQAGGDARPASPTRQNLQELLVQPDQAFAAAQIGEGEAKAKALKVGDSHGG